MIQIKTTKWPKAIHTLPTGQIIIDDSDLVMQWTFSDEDVDELCADESGRKIYNYLIRNRKQGSTFFTPNDCADAFFEAVEALDGRKEMTPAWRICDAVLVGAHTAIVNQTAMEVVWNEGED